MVAPSPKFLKSHPFTAKWEGGWSDHPEDRGGKTMFGVTQPTFDGWNDMRGYPRRPVATITRAEALQLFFDDYWTAARCEGLALGVDLATYDAAVNSGVSRGRKWLLASLDPNNDHVRTIKGICARRLGFVQALKNWKTFGRGWSNRIADIQATAVAWALGAANDNTVVVAHLEDEASRKGKVAVRQGAAAGGSAPIGTGALVNSQLADWLMVGIGAGLVALALFLLWRTMVNRDQARAFSAKAGELAHAA